MLIFSLGCVTTQPNYGLVLNLQSDPPAVFQNSITKVHVDITNTDIKRLENVKAEIFNPGLMSPLNNQLCVQRGDFGTLFAGEFRTFSCDFSARQINQDRVRTTLDAKAIFDADFEAVQQVELITEQEYNNRVASSGVQLKPQSYVYNDRNIELRVDFTDSLPVVIKEGRQFFVRFTIRNIGNGFINALKPEDVSILQKPSLEQGITESNVLQSVNAQGNFEPCRLEETLLPIGKEFPSFSCQIFMPSNARAITNYNFIIQIRYHYEIRDSVTVDIVR
ncbi:MAG: hypothetical protein HY514_03935 [Candidatus Aenigmarchaeota archaeon]|nr:hypothetical protein [Candidatus Aenigmarchaeota archaeon]